MLEINPVHRLPVILNPLKVKQFLVARVTFAREVFIRVRARKSSAAPIAKVLRALSTSHLVWSATRKSQADHNDKRKEMTHMITPR
jgi:hypothetical protein